ncbi:TPA: DUF2269 domain-containing protein [Legionella pneumophila]|nr:DUF2269 domain-containing protein [Legionella pneumophila]MDW8880256.1 DUF2269 domain-containing protein [Legionella pneumophila subsp. fraseri]MDW8963228.1 DUF2269 domain-containing protein [Legionella pneumophila subsp. fraseri]MDW9036819.1 DUF2269 domain-containing protein [Legionella pneumophila subsp. fraseri]MDW9040023.1 DUF2269 domain-containing protein [Legionella pneumophila subsp. fraseri]MDW9043013.1 DUF2269 domain-containing protein [Legionella pneumophila subsp. fraseri]
MLYFYLKFIHILSSTILFGTGIGTASVMVYGHRTKNPIVIAAISKYVVFADWIFTGTSGIVQPLTGFAMVYLAGFSWTSFWILGSILGYVIAACCWFPVVYLQIRIRDLAIESIKNNTTLPNEYHRYFLYWFILGWPAFLSLIGVFYLMTNKPAF